MNKCERCQKIVPELKPLDYTFGGVKGTFSVCPKCFDFLTGKVQVEFT